MPESGTLVLLALAAFAAGACNAVAGGGTLLTFPALNGVLSPAIANATSTIALLPGSLAGAWGYRSELREVRGQMQKLLPVSLVGGATGALLLVLYPNTFETLVPWLVLAAAVLFTIQPLVSKWLKRGASPGEPGWATAVGVQAFQFLVAVYGGYFGAGIGILMLTALAFLNVGDIHRMNSIKTVLAAAINAVSVVLFIAWNLIDWPIAGVMAGASVLGGYAGARVARRIPAKVVRIAVACIGFALAAWYFLK
jgi:uncharacterized protein